MTVPTSDNREQYQGNDSATEFDYTFKIFKASDLVVILTDSDDAETTLVRGTDYSVDGVGEESGGTVTYPLSGDPLATGQTLTILREIPVVQETDLRNQGAYYPETIEDELDRSRMIDQQQQEEINRSLKKSEGGDHYDAQGKRIIGLGMPADDQDAMSKRAVYEYFSKLESGALGDTTKVSTSTGTQTLADALDNRTIYAKTVTELVVLSASEGQEAMVSGCPFIYSGGAWSPSAGYVTPMAYGAAGDNITDDTAAFQAATDAAGTVIVPSTPDGYYLAGFLQTSKPGNRFIGLGMPKIRSASKFSKVFHNDFYVEGLDIASDSNDYIVIGQPTSSAGLDNVKAHKCRFFGGFYAFRVGLEVTDPNTWRASNVSVTECYSEAPIGLNAGHFFCTKTDKVLYDNNEVKYGLNSSAYGAASCSRVTITNNRESEVSDSANDVEAAIQVEDSVDSQTIISGNECQHDIWVSSSENVLVFGNLCRELRVSIGNADAGGVDNTKFIGNTAGRIRLDKFAVNPPAVTYSARFISNTLKPGDYQKEGAFLANAIFVNADNHCGEVTFSDNEIIPYSGTAVALSRTGANAVIKFYDNDLGTDGHSVAGSSGFFEERNNTNPIYLTKNGSIEAGLSADIAPVNGSWTDLVLSREGIDINGEVNNTNGVITAVKAGFYEITGIFTVTTTSSIGVGLRVVRNLDGLEICRLFYLPTSSSGPNCTPLRAGRFYLNKGQEIKLQYFVTGAGATIESSPILTSIEINRD